MDIILTHSNADFDALAAQVAAAKIFAHAVPILPDRCNRNVSDFLTLYRSGLPFLRLQDIHLSEVTRIILVDTQRVPDIRGLRGAIPVSIIDHHLPARDLAAHESFSGESTGAATTLLVEKLRQIPTALSSLEATLLMLGIYEDTGSLVYGTTTPRDILAAAWLLEQHAALDTVRRFLTHPLNAEQQALLEVLLKNAQSRQIQGHTVVVAAASSSEYVSEISSVAHRLRDMLDPAALFVVAAMPNALHMVCRATGEAVDVGEIARLFGGGGHERAAAATIHDKTAAEVVQKLWEILPQRMHPQTRIADLMSFGVQTVDANKPIKEIIQMLRRVGHEGYPVLDKGQVVGLLMQRDAARALEHGLGHLAVREVMSGGAYTLTPDDPVAALEQLIVDTGWGQIPVVNASNRLLGIVTRTDLIRHWARKHPPSPAPQPILTRERQTAILGISVQTLIDTITHQAQEQGHTLYMVGGVVRDLLLNRANDDIDFVIEQDAIAFAQSLEQRCGGHVSSFRPFGTAKWILDERVRQNLSITGALPDHIDFATSRYEFYEHPTALPTVYSSSIKLDMQRRDFTINALAIQLSPPGEQGRILDFFGGQDDLQARVVRVLHSLSFVDDPTRIIRAVRFARRLNFSIDPRTEELMTTALPMLRRITGERVRHEITLLLREHEPEHGLLDLKRRGVLTAIHPAFDLESERLGRWFEHARTGLPTWLNTAPDRADLYWHMIGLMIAPEALPGLCERLMIARTLALSMIGAAQIAQEAPEFVDWRPSRITARLREFPETALLAAWLVAPEDTRAVLERYMREWRAVKTHTTGHTLRARGLTPGPRYKAILERLLYARLDSEILSVDDEETLLQKLLQEPD